MSSWSKVARRIRVPLGFLFAVVYLWLAKPSKTSLTCGLVFIVAGLTTRAIASGHLRKNEILAMTGPYAYTRNPLYLGSLITAIGFTVAARSLWVAAILIIFFLVIYLPVIQDEEAYLAARFPEFAEYASRVPRFGLGIAAATPGQSSFSWKLYWKHREYNATLGSMALIGALLAKMIWLRR
jgi:protein-S-isoprenylcysteine O-methyltransferase Ste14